MKPIHPDERYHKLPTMTVGELIEELRKRDSEMPVVAVWETTWNAIAPESFTESGAGHLLVDVENH